jgi:hypothetical protein
LAALKRHFHYSSSATQFPNVFQGPTLFATRHVLKMAVRTPTAAQILSHGLPNDLPNVAGARPNTRTATVRTNLSPVMEIGVAQVAVWAVADVRFLAGDLDAKTALRLFLTYARRMVNQNNATATTAGDTATLPRTAPTSVVTLWARSDPWRKLGVKFGFWPLSRVISTSHFTNASSAVVDSASLSTP